MLRISLLSKYGDLLFFTIVQASLPRFYLLILSLVTGH
jgi:hypothetical protein